VLNPRNVIKWRAVVGVVEGQHSEQKCHTNEGWLQIGGNKLWAKNIRNANLFEKEGPEEELVRIWIAGGTSFGIS
jgi:hypothetical protein